MNDRRSVFFGIRSHEECLSVSIESKASPKAESVSEYTVPVCEGEPTSPFVTAEVCPTEASTVVSGRRKEFRLLSLGRLNKSFHHLAEPVEEVVLMPAEEGVHGVPLLPTGEEISIPISEAVEPIRVARPPIIEIPWIIPREFPLYPPPSPTISSPVKTTLSVSTTTRSPGVSHFLSP
jgi:hypothetical protein